MDGVCDVESQQPLRCSGAPRQQRPCILPYLAGCLCLSVVAISLCRWSGGPALWAQTSSITRPAVTHRLSSQNNVATTAAPVTLPREGPPPPATPAAAADPSAPLPRPRLAGPVGWAALGLAAAGLALAVGGRRRSRGEGNELEFAVFMVVQGQPLTTVLVTGATGRTGSLVVKALLEKSSTVRVRALVRNKQKAAEVLPASDRVEVVQGDVGDEKKLRAACDGVDAVIWCSTAFSSNNSPLDTFLTLFGMKVLKRPVDSVALKAIGEAMRLPEGQAAGYPRVVMCSSSAVTRSTWPEEKKQRLVGAADIPIVRLNPFGVLDMKRESEQVLRDTGVSYTIVRPTGLNAQVETGRPIFSQGDVAVGRISRGDVAELLVRLLFEEAGCVGKTFEVLALPGLPAPCSYTQQLARLKPDTEPLDEAVVQAHYNILQQLLPGEMLEANQLAMGQTYEQLDRGETGRLGPRGAEAVPGAQTFGGQ